MIIGAGGAARGISFALHKAGYGPITFTNRTVEKAQQLCAEIPEANALSLAEAEESLSSYGLIIQTTSVGMNFANKGFTDKSRNILPKGPLWRILFIILLKLNFLMKLKKEVLFY